jgi:hypothetical protein
MTDYKVSRQWSTACEPNTEIYEISPDDGRNLIAGFVFDSKTAAGEVVRQYREVDGNIISLRGFGKKLPEIRRRVELAEAWDAAIEMHRLGLSLLGCIAGAALSYRMGREL